MEALFDRDENERQGAQRTAATDEIELRALDELDARVLEGLALVDHGHLGLTAVDELLHHPPAEEAAAADDDVILLRDEARGSAGGGSG